MVDLFPLLAFDLSTPATLVLLQTGPDSELSRLRLGDNRTEQLFPAIREMLEEAGLALRDMRSLGVGRGPGAFTGVRNAVMAAKTLAHVLRLPLYSPTSLEVLAQGTEDGEIVASLIDARRREVYCCIFRRVDGLLEPLGPPEVLPPAEVAVRIGAAGARRAGEPVLVGTGVLAYREVLAAAGRVVEDPCPRPTGLLKACRHAAERGARADPLGLLPLYIRRPDARERGTGTAPCGSGR